MTGHKMLYSVHRKQFFFFFTFTNILERTFGVFVCKLTSVIAICIYCYAFSIKILL